MPSKWALWTGGTQLRGANIWQRIRVPSLDGDEIMGSGHIGPPYTQADFDRLAALGANYVNLSVPGLFTERPPYVLDEEAQANLDALITMAARADLFVVISFRTGPGRSDFTFYRDGAGVWFPPELLVETVWTSEAAQVAWALMWRHTAARYRDNPVVVGYDLMVEPNADEVALNIYDPSEFYPRFANTTYDWNRFYPRIVEAIRQVDPSTPILVSGMGWGSVLWLPYLQPVSDPYLVFAVHQYAPFQYTHQQPGDNRPYPGRFDLDWDNRPDLFDWNWMASYLSRLDTFQQQHPAPQAVNEFGVVRWAPNAADFMRDEIAYFEGRGMNHAIWVWEPSWEPWRTVGSKAMNYLLGPDPNNFQEEDNALLRVILASWSRNTVRPSGTLATTHTFTPSTADIPNPERGIYNWPDDFTPAALADHAARGYTLAYQREGLGDYLASDLPPAYLAALAARFQAVRQAGLKVILRFAYNEGETYPDPAPDAALPQLLRHIEQLAPVLAENKDVIAWIEAGFIGAWGEWHTSASGLDSPPRKATVRDALFNHFPPDRFLLFRYPGDFTAWYPQPVSPALAFTEHPQARLGHHNDCFLASDDDEGTYLDEEGRLRAQEWKAYIAEMGRFVPVSGETCHPNPPRSDCGTALFELEMLHWSALNEGWHPDVISAWKAQGCYEEIRRRLGYRLTLHRATFPATVPGGGTLEVQVHLANTGFASPLLPRPVLLLLHGQNRTVSTTVPVDPRRWEAGEHSFRALLELPPDLPGGEYTVALWLPDPAEKLRSDPRYALRFANEGTWDREHGWNVLGHVRVQAAVAAGGAVAEAASSQQQQAGITNRTAPLGE